MTLSFGRSPRLSALSAVVGLFGLILCVRCTHSESPRQTVASVTNATTIRHTGNGWELLRYGRPYFIKGAGSLASNRHQFERLRACGGNSIRTWDVNEADQVLDQAQALGLTVHFGLWIERETEGFDYNDQAATDRQFERMRKLVMTYRHHPALLMWCVGNESAEYGTNLNVYDEVNRIARMIHELDPDHPVTTAVSLDSERSVWLARERCPDIDIMSFNVYGDIPHMADFLQKGGWTGPYILSEFGSRGYWEVEKTPWESPIEPTSRQKYDFINQYYRQYISPLPPNCLGSYLFLWGSKQEETHTWFSFFDDQGRESPLVGLMQELWTGKRPANQAPVVGQLLTDGRATTSLSFTPSAGMHRAEIVATDPDNDPLTYRWEIRQAARQRSDFEDAPSPVISGLIDTDTTPVVQFRLPQAPGAYRLFVYVYDTHLHVSTANLAFQVAQKANP